MKEYPMANARPAGYVDEVAEVVAARKLVSAADDVKWNELISFMRALEGWQPSYRSKSITGFICEWDVEWYYHLPFPFNDVEWFDMGLHQIVTVGRLLPKKVIDHSPLILPELTRIGFEHEVRGDVVRIWGYLPRSYEDFPPAQG